MPGPGVIVTERAVEQHSGLPAEVSSLVGRGPQLAAVLDGLRAARVVTLTGAGGCGKTRLALAVAGLLAGLAGKSLVQVQAGPTIRYALLETVRQFAAGRLAASGEGTAVHARLLRWALEVARSAEAALPGAEWPRWSDRLSADQANIRAALSWALGGAEPGAGRELAARLAGGGSPPAGTAT